MYIDTRRALLALLGAAWLAACPAPRPAPRRPAPASAPASPPVAPPRALWETAPNGLRLVHQDQDTDRYAVALSLSRPEDDPLAWALAVAWLSSLLARPAPEGTPQLSLSVAPTSLVIWAEGPADERRAGIEALASLALSAPTEDASRAALVEEAAALLRREREQPWLVMARALRGAPPLPEEAELRAGLQALSLAGARERVFLPQRAGLALVGDLSAEEALGALSPFLGWTAAPGSPAASLPGWCVIELPRAAKLMIAQSVVWPERTSPEVAGLLSARLALHWMAAFGPRAGLSPHLWAEAVPSESLARYGDFVRRWSRDQEEPLSDALLRCALASSVQMRAAENSPRGAALALAAAASRGGSRADPRAEPAPDAVLAAARGARLALVLAGSKEALAPFQREIPKLRACP